MSRVLVTGTTGFIGRFAVPALLAGGHEVHALGRTAPDATAVRHHPADLLDQDAVQAAVASCGATHLLHLAWCAEPGAYWRSPANLDWVAASLALLRAFREGGGSRAVTAGTCAEYAWGADRLREGETPCRPATLYGAAKDGFRRIGASYAAAEGFSFATGRVFFLFGPGEKTGRLVSDAARTLLRGGTFGTSHGRQRRDFLHVRDVAEAFVALLESNVTGPVNIGSGAAVPVRSLSEAVAAEAGGHGTVAFGARALAPSEPDTIEASTDRLAGEVGFRPRIGLAAGIAETVRWWRDRGVT